MSRAPHLHHRLQRTLLFPASGCRLFLDPVARTAPRARLASSLTSMSFASGRAIAGRPAANGAFGRSILLRLLDLRGEPLGSKSPQRPPRCGQERQDKARVERRAQGSGCEFLGEGRARRCGAAADRRRLPGKGAIPQRFCDPGEAELAPARLRARRPRVILGRARIRRVTSLSLHEEVAVNVAAARCWLVKKLGVCTTPFAGRRLGWR